MLILSRRIGESIHINDDIKITVLGTCGRQIRLGFEAPPNTPIHRNEIYDKIQLEKKYDITYVKKSKRLKVLS
jgi:carbon storage regulator